MKKTLIMFLFIFLSFTTLCGCSYLDNLLGFETNSNENSNGNNNENSNNNNNHSPYTSITIYYKNTQRNYQIREGGYLHIQPVCDKGEIVTGIYDSREGGQLYFDISNEGTSYINITAWSLSFPTTLYAQYSEPVYSYTSSIYNYENPEKYINISDSLKGNFGKSLYFGDSKTLSISVTFEVLDASTGVYSFVSKATLGVGTKDSGYEKLNTISYSKNEVSKNSYTQKTISGSCSSQLVINRDYTIYIVLDSMNSVGYYMGKFKNITFRISAY